MTTFGDLVDEVFLSLEGWGLAQDRAAFIGADALAAASDDLLFTVDDATNLSAGVAEIGDELVYIQSVNASTNSITIAPDGRGYRGTTIALHGTNTRVTMNPTIPREVVKRKINETITGVYPTLRGQASTEITQVGTQIAYEVPADLDEVLALTYQATGPSQVWPNVHHYRLDKNANTTDFATGQSLSIFGPLEIGATMRLTYTKKPTELSALSDELTTSGLADTARAAIVAGAIWRLSTYITAARLRVHTVATDAFDESRSLQDANQVAAYLRAQYEVELVEEKNRQDIAQPPTINHLD